MTTEKEIIVALEFGSSAIRGIAGHRELDGSMSILAIEQEQTTDGVRKGVIYNIDKTTQAISRIINRINDKLDIYVTRAYVGLSGQSLHTASNFVSRQLDTKVKITADLVDSLMDSNSATVYTDSEILDVAPQEYRVDSRSVQDPIGVQCEHIEARYMNVVAKTILQENIQKCMQGAGIEIADLFISPLALADSMLNDNEKRSGCALVDFGADTTTVSVYSGNLLRHLVVIPLGGNNITQDIASSQQMEAEEAEQLKRKNGIAYVASDSDTPRNFPISNERTLNENELQNIIGARQEEIIHNVWNQISSMSDKLLSGIIITGGASQLRDMTEAIKHHTHFAKVKIAKALITSTEVAPGVTTPAGGSVDVLIALLRHGEADCKGEAPTIELEPAVAEILEQAEDTNREVKVEEPVIEEPKEEKHEEPQEPKAPKKPFGERLKGFGRAWSKLFTEEEEE